MIELNGAGIEQAIGSHGVSYDKQGKSAWGAFLSWDKLFLILASISLLSFLAALFVLLSPLLNVVLNFMGLHYAGWNAWVTWIVAGEKGLIVAVSLGLIALLFAVLARYRLRRNYSVYVEAGCPQCHEQELVRVRRNRRDRALGTFGFPVRRYSCRNCTWHGMRLAGYRQHKPKETMDGPKADLIEADRSEPALEFVEESLAVAADKQVVMDAEMTVHNGNADAIWIKETADTVEEPDPFVEEEVVDTDNEPVEEIVVLPFVAETAEIVEGEEDEDIDEPIVEEPSPELDEQALEIQNDVQEEALRVEVVEIDADEDDDFARLCHDVALGNKR